MPPSVPRSKPTSQTKHERQHTRTLTMTNETSLKSQENDAEELSPTRLRITVQNPYRAEEKSPLEFGPKRCCGQTIGPTEAQKIHHIAAE